LINAVDDRPIVVSVVTFNLSRTAHGKQLRDEQEANDSGRQQIDESRKQFNFKSPHDQQVFNSKFSPRFHVSTASLNSTN
jgi:hypothetical protein